MASLSTQFGNLPKLSDPRQGQGLAETQSNRQGVK